MSCVEGYPHFRGKCGTEQSVFITEVSLFQGCPFRGVSTVVCSNDHNIPVYFLMDNFCDHV